MTNTLDTFAGCLELMKSEEPFRSNIEKYLPQFPPVEGPLEYKEALSGLLGGKGFVKRLNEPLEALGNRSALDALRSRDYPDIQEYVKSFITLLIVGPGAQ